MTDVAKCPAKDAQGQRGRTEAKESPRSINEELRHLVRSESLQAGSIQNMQTLRERNG